MFKYRNALVILILIVWLYIVYQIRIGSGLSSSIINIVSNNIVGVIIFVMLQAVFAASFLPCSLFTLVAGSVWGIEYGIAISTIATVFASTLTYAIARLANKNLQKTIYNHIPNSVVNFTNRNPFVSSLLFHVNPLFPGSLSGYIFGLKGIPFTKYLFGCFIGTLPLQVLFIYVGNGLVR